MVIDNKGKNVCPWFGMSRCPAFYVIVNWVCVGFGHCKMLVNLCKIALFFGKNLKLRNTVGERQIPRSTLISVQFAAQRLNVQFGDTNPEENPRI